jgi:hypothetical protein
MSISLITTTGSRPAAFELCEKFMARQTYKGEIQWIVVDDSPKNPTKCTMGQQYVVGPKEWKPGINTQRYSLDVALPLVKGDYVFIIEDDDRYAESYLATYVDMLKHADIVGEGNVTYYSLKVKGFKEMGNLNHASTCQTAFRRNQLGAFERAVHSGEKYFDILYWNTLRANKSRYILFHGLSLCTGMKGLPGRGGIGFGHTNTHEFTPDSNFVKLKQLVGEEDAKLYINMVK